MIKSKVTNYKYMTHTNITCQFTNLIYCIECLSCGKNYIGQTQRYYGNIRQDRYKYSA